MGQQLTMTSEWLLNMSIEVLYLPEKFYTSQYKFLATPGTPLHAAQYNSTYSHN